MIRRLMVGIAMLLPMAAQSTPAWADDQAPDAVAERLRNDAVRAENRGDYERADEARNAAAWAELSDADGARDVERDYNRGN